MRDDKKIKLKLTKALRALGARGRVLKVFAPRFGSAYSVGLVQLPDNSKAVLKIKSNRRGGYVHAYTRKAEWENLLLLERNLCDRRLPKPLKYKDGVLLMSYIDGKPLKQVDQSKLPGKVFYDLGSLLRKINDIPLPEDRKFVTLRDFTSLFRHEWRLLEQERLALDFLPRSFYTTLKRKLETKIKTKNSDELGLIAKDSFGSENILIKNSRLAGLVDFEDLMIAPRILQLRPRIEKRFLPYYRKGYGEKAFDRNFNKQHLLLLDTISTLRALYLALDEGDEHWLKIVRRDYAKNLRLLRIDHPLPLEIKTLSPS